MKNLTVSRKVYADITSRINSALSHSAASATEAIRLVDAHIAGGDAVSDDATAMLAFNMIKPELDRAMVRSQRARERARARKAAKEAGTPDQPVATAETRMDVAGPEVRLSRRDRRALQRAACPRKKNLPLRKNSLNLQHERERTPHTPGNA